MANFIPRHSPTDSKTRSLYRYDEDGSVRVRTDEVKRHIIDQASGSVVYEGRSSDINTVLDLVASSEGDRISYDYSTTGNQKVTQSSARAFRVIPIEGETTVFARLRDPDVTNNANLTLWSNIEERW